MEGTVHKGDQYLIKILLAAAKKAITNGAFPLQGAERIGSQRCGTGCVSTAKSGRDPDLAVSVLASFSVLLLWGNENEARRLKGSREILATHPPPLIGRQNHHFRATWG